MNDDGYVFLKETYYTVSMEGNTYNIPSGIMVVDESNRWDSLNEWLRQEFSLGLNTKEVDYVGDL